MANNRQKIFPYKSLPYVVFFLSCCFLVYLLFTIRADVFFSGDAGLKYLVLNQVNQGGVYKTLNIAKPAWVQHIWAEGFYPFKPPFIYDTPHGRLVSFPPAFQWINAPFFKLFGYKGMYVVPCASLLLLWFWFIVTLRRQKVSPLVITAAMFLLSFCSPLTVYGAIYWEHTLATLLSFSGIVYLLERPSSYIKAFLLGCLSGTAVWLRPEAIVICGLLAFTVFYNYERKKKYADLIFVFGVALIILSFFVFNKAEYGNILGAHSIQVMDQSTGAKLTEGFTHLTHINARLFIFFPAALIFYALVVYLYIKRRFSMPAVIYELTSIIILFSIITPFILPNAGGKQWGPRYFMLIVPAMITVISLALMHLPLSTIPLRKWRFVIILLLAYSVYLDVFKSAKTLRDDYAYRVSPGLQFLKSDPTNVVVVQNQFIAQEFAAVFEEKNVFLAEDETAFYKLQSKLRSAGISEIVYMAISNESKALPNMLENGGRNLHQVGDYFFGKYILR